jgi:hypothetical protein
MAGPPQQGDQLQDKDGQQQAAEDQEFGLHGASVGRPGLIGCVPV